MIAAKEISFMGANSNWSCIVGCDWTTRAAGSPRPPRCQGRSFASFKRALPLMVIFVGNGCAFICSVFKGNSRSWRKRWRTRPARSKGNFFPQFFFCEVETNPWKHALTKVPLNLFEFAPESNTVDQKNISRASCLPAKINYIKLHVPLDAIYVYFEI